MSDAHALIVPLTDLLHDAREGAPRWLSLRLPTAADVPAVVRAAAAAAEGLGFVPVSVDDYVRRGELIPELAERTLLLIAVPGTAAPRRRALMHAAARSSRPHVLLDLRVATAPLSKPPLSKTPLLRSQPLPSMAREARVAYGAPRGPAVSEDVARHLRRAERCDALVRAGSHAAAERLLRDVLGAITRRRAWPVAVEVSVSLGRVLLERGRAIEAAAAFESAAAHAYSAGDERAAARARIWQAAARVDAGLLVAAEAQCRAALAVSIPCPEAEAQARATLARTLIWQGRAGEAADVDFGATSDVGGDPYVLSQMVRVALARGDHFEAGMHVAALTAQTGNAGPLPNLMARTAELRLQAAMGDLVAGARTILAIRQAARDTRTPMRLLRARLIWVEALRRAGRPAELARELTWLGRMRGAAPPQLRTAIEMQLRGEPFRRVSATRRSVAALSPAALLVIARDEEDDRVAVGRLLELVATGLACGRVDLHSADAGPATTVVSVGSGQPSMLGRRVLDAGVAIGPEAREHAIELAVPVRLGTTLLAALSARWPADRRPAPDAAGVLDMVAAIAAPRIESMREAAREQARGSVLVPELIGGSAVMTDLRKAIAKAASAPFAVMIQGESGVGKELAARAIHQLGPRRERRLCDINCAAIPDDLLESELFGHARGAFTGAVADRPGLFEDANGGTLFLDEVADLSARAQAALLRVIQQQEVRRIGETFSRPVDVRVVAAANRDLRAEAEAGRFRRDLLYRLDVIHLVIPPLRERPDDIATLAAHFWRSASARVGSTAALTHGVLAAMARYQWPGNVRELMNVVSALAVAAPARGAVRPHLLPAAIAGAAQIRSARLADARQAFERRFVEAALARAGGSRTQAARELGVSRQGLLKILTRVGAA